MLTLKFRPILEKLSKQEKSDDRKDEKDFKDDKKNALTPLQSKELTRQKKINDIFENSNKGKLSTEGIKELAAQIERGDVRYEGFPDWVLKTWMNPEEKGAIPFLNNRWLDVKSIVADEDDDDFDLAKRVYAGIVVNHARKEETGIKSVNLLQFRDLAVEKMRKLLTFERAVIEAQKLIDRKNNREKSTAGMQTAGGTAATPASQVAGGGGSMGGDLGAATGGSPTDVAPPAPVPGGTAQPAAAPTPAAGSEIPFDANGSPSLGDIPIEDEEEEKTK